MATPNSELIKNFETLISKKDASEQDLQDYLERNPTLFYPAHQLNHGVHLAQIISKFPLDTSLKTDFAYLTKSSAEWWLVFVEIEKATKKLFTESNCPTAEFTAAMTQVRTWRTFVDKHPEEIKRRIEPLKKPLEKNKIVFKYMLVIGRSTDFVGNQQKIDAFQELQQSDFKILTFDSLISAYKHSPNTSLDVLVAKEQKFGFKLRHREHTAAFSCLSPNDLHLEAEDIKFYKDREYDMDGWLKGDLLVVNDKQTKDKFAPNFKTTLVETNIKTDQPSL